jgi:hypothetical protein
MTSDDIVERGKPLQVVMRETPAPVGTQVLVKVDACGVCHSDLHIRHGSLDLGNGRRVTPLPTGTPTIDSGARRRHSGGIASGQPLRPQRRQTKLEAASTSGPTNCGQLG